MILSIIIPSFEQGSELNGALQSIAQQTFNDYEIIIVDGGSTDTTSAVVSTYPHLPIVFIRESDDGIYDAMNKGVKFSKGEFLYFMGCDDRLYNSDILNNVFNVPNATNSHVIYGNVIFAKSLIKYDGRFTALKLMNRNICHQAIFVRRVVFDKLGLFDVRYKTYADWEFNMRWFNAKWIKKKYVPLVIALFNEAGFSSNLQDVNFFRDQAMLEKRYFTFIERYLSAYPYRPLHNRVARVLSLIDKLRHY
ncbi:glycosyltransferase family 2 protein [Hymenobacter jejuensis]|uniref:Glycosyltransferase n=1 Tax=Hymenobacter jejuensis TaxID=2502781 RepID=A0A5B7ZW31_9BACT|nr:glycosyltransferase family 2 protein [Hymenobacter jejuensis]QDA59351.1 glycosyltransferase [Hymenobacter jejuensis]